MPNPFYPAYGAGARAAGCEQIYLPTTARQRISARSRFARRRDCWRARWPSSSPRPPTRRARSPSPDYFARLKQLADRYGFFILSDECYSEIYTTEAPGSALECAGPDFTNVIAFQSLSKRSNLPGMRVGFAAGDKKFLAAFHRAAQCRRARRCRCRCSMSRSLPTATRRMSRRTAGFTGIKFDLADQILGNRYGYRAACRRLLRLARRLRPRRR